jgi:hypothetical protein
MLGKLLRRLRRGLSRGYRDMSDGRHADEVGHAGQGR